MSNMKNTQSSKTKSSIKKKSDKQTKPADTSENGFANSPKAKTLVKKNVRYTVPHLYAATKHDCHRCSLMDATVDSAMQVHNMFLSSGDGIQLAVIRDYLPIIEDYHDLEKQLGEAINDYDRHRYLAFSIGVESKHGTPTYYYALEFNGKTVIGHGLHLFNAQMSLSDVSIYQNLPIDENDSSRSDRPVLIAKCEMLNFRLGPLATAYIAMICARWYLEYNLSESAHITLKNMSKANANLYRRFESGTIYLHGGFEWVPYREMVISDLAGYAEASDLMRLLADLANGTRKFLRE